MSTQDAQQRLAALRLPVNDRPKYYDAQVGESVPISDGLQDFAITVDPYFREEILGRIQDSEGESADFRSILLTACAAEIADSEVMLQDYDSRIGDYDTFRKNSALTQNVSELAKVQKDIQTGYGALLESRDHHFHRKQLASLIETVYTWGENNSQTDRQKASWPEVFRSYE